MTDARHKLARDLGVVWSVEHAAVVIYRLVVNGSGTKVEAHLLGSEERLAPSEELRDVIQADMRKRGLYSA